MKMIAKFSSVCCICERKIKAGSDSIRYVAGEPVVHHMCHERMVDTVCPGYMSAPDFAAERGEERARWDAASAKVARVSQASDARRSSTDEGSFGGSQDAEDFGNF